MRDDLRIAPLTFPGIPVGPRETPPDLTRLLYKGGARVRADKTLQAIQDGLLGALRSERLELVHAIHEVISGKLAGGGSPTSARNQVDDAVVFFSWADDVDAALTKAEVQATYVRWAEHLFHRCKVAKDISERTAYTSALRVGQLLDGVLERQKPILHLTRLTKPSQRKAPLGVEAEKQNLHGTFAFGRLLQAICDGLTLKAIWGLHVEIPLQEGGFVVLWTGGSTPRTERTLESWEVRRAEERRQEYESDRSLEHRGRKAVVNTRILAELLMFIGQTGMNLAQTHKLKLRHFSYSSDIDGYKVRDYKHRRGGEVLFEIFSDYRSHFERYLDWRRAIFPDSVELFPIVREGSHESRAPLFDLVIGLCKQAGVPWTPPSVLRGTRVNWLLRRSGDPDLTAEVSQHHKKVLLEVYEQPSLQRTIGEVARFWQGTDPTLASTEPLRAVAPGACDGKPVVSPAKPETAPSPDCIRPSGCLWCEHHRDIDTQDYVWSLACFRHLKVLEVSKHCFPSKSGSRQHPAQHAIDKLSEKLTWFKNSNAIRRSWVEVALACVEEGSYPLLFDEEQLRITDEDLKIARRLTPNLPEDEFAVGKIWTLAWHQYRRTGAVNMFASGVISDSSMQQQMKHSTRLMPLYYGQGHTRLHLNEEVEQAVVKAMYESMAHRLKDVVSDRFISPHSTERKEAIAVNVLSAKDVKTLAAWAKSGQVSFRENRLGGCMKPGPCEYGGIESVARCGGGDSGKPCTDVVYDREKATQVRAQLHQVVSEMEQIAREHPRYVALAAERLAMENYLNVVAAAH